MSPHYYTTLGTQRNQMICEAVKIPLMTFHATREFILFIWNRVIILPDPVAATTRIPTVVYQRTHTTMLSPTM
jgi:hypothetical protein